MSKKLLSSQDLGRLKKWLIKEFDAKELDYKKNEFQFNCPWCDNKEGHCDYTFNIVKQEGHCWRGFNENCESGHSLLVFVSFYYRITFKEAKELIKNKFESENSLHRIKSKIRAFELNRSLDVENERIVWDLPRGVESILQPSSPGARKALAWLRVVRKIPDEVLELLDPKFAGTGISKWMVKHYGRIFFPVHSLGNRAWLSYSMGKKHTKKNPKTHNPPGPILSQMLFLYDFYTKSTEPILLCEGIFDALRLFLFGFNSVALFGTSVSEAQLELLNRLPTNEVVVCLDIDATKPKKNKKGGWTSKAFRLSRTLRDYYIGETSLMRIYAPKGFRNPEKFDPDLLSYDNAVRFFNDRESFSMFAATMRRLKARLK